MTISRPMVTPPPTKVRVTTPVEMAAPVQSAVPQSPASTAHIVLSPTPDSDSTPWRQGAAPPMPIDDYIQPVQAPPAHAPPPPAPVPQSPVMPVQPMLASTAKAGPPKAFIPQESDLLKYIKENEGRRCVCMLSGFCVHHPPITRNIFLIVQLHICVLIVFVIF